MIQIINQRHIMSKKASKHTDNKQFNKRVTIDERNNNEDSFQGSSRRRLKKLNQINAGQEMLEEESLGGKDYLIEDDEQEDVPSSRIGKDVIRERQAPEQLKKRQKPNERRELDKFIQKKQKEKLQPHTKKEGKPSCQLTIESMMRFKKDKPPPSKNIEDFVRKDEDHISSDRPEPETRRASAYEKYNGSMEDEEKLLQMALKLSLTAASKHQNLQDYAYEDPKPNKSKQTKEVKEPSHPIKHDKISANKKVQPKSQGKKEVKRSKSNPKQVRTGPFAGLVIAFTGGYTGIDKDKLIEVCVQLGAECPKSITKKCNLLLQGSHVEDQYKRKLPQPIQETQKSKEAKERGIQIIPFDKLQDFFIEKTGKTLDDHINKNNAPNRSLSSILPRAVQGSKDEDFPSGQTIIDDGQLWTEKYKPNRLEDVVGEASQIKSLREWLEAWQDIHIRGNKREVKDGKSWGSLAAGNINSSAALISGDPGIGKTTTARLLAMEYNYSVTEFNASDVRNKSGVNLLQSTSYNLDVFHNLTRPLIIMDEVDGMSSGDRGGVAAIISMIKSTKVPIICICNDRGSQKIRSLAGHCLDVRFHKPHKGMIVKRLKQILYAEGGSGEDRALEQLVQTFQNDMRQLLTYLQMVFRTISRKITVDSLNRRNSSAKDPSVMATPFQAARRLLNRTEFSSMRISLRTDCFFIDSDLVPLLVHENLLSSARKTPLKGEEFHRLVQGVKGMVIGDMLDRTIRKQQEWGLMPSFGFMTCVYATEKISESMGFPQFPSWLGKFSSERKLKRLAKEFKNAIFPATGVSSWKTAKTAYVPLLIKQLSQSLRRDDVEEAVGIMEYYRISPPMISDHLASLYYSPDPNPIADLPAPTKAKLTRIFNKRHQEARLAKGKTKGKQVAEQPHMKFDPLMEEPEVQEQAEIEQEEKGQKEEKSEDSSLPKKQKQKGKSKPKQAKKDLMSI